MKGVFGANMNMACEVRAKEEFWCRVGVAEIAGISSDLNVAAISVRACFRIRFAIRSNCPARA